MADRSLGMDHIGLWRRCDAADRKRTLAVDQWLVRLVLRYRGMSSNCLACESRVWHHIFGACSIFSCSFDLARRADRAPVRNISNSFSNMAEQQTAADSR